MSYSALWEKSLELVFTLPHPGCGAVCVAVSIRLLLTAMLPTTQSSVLIKSVVRSRLRFCHFQALSRRPPVTPACVKYNFPKEASSQKVSPMLFFSAPVVLKIFMVILGKPWAPRLPWKCSFQNLFPSVAARPMSALCRKTTAGHRQMSHFGFARFCKVACLG